MQQKYNLEFILDTKGASAEEIEQALVDLGDQLQITQAEAEPSAAAFGLKICLRTEDPALIFDTCSQFGKLRSVKID
jgi:dihydroxyacetone kinase-like predicted kinase